MKPLGVSGDISARRSAALRKISIACSKLSDPLLWFVSNLIMAHVPVGEFMASKSTIRKISVIVPRSPFTGLDQNQVRHCLAALDVEKLIAWWPGQPHSPHRDPNKVRAIQRSLDWKRVAKIAAYLLQQEIQNTPDQLDSCFKNIYAPKKLEPGREWPPRVRRVTGFDPSEYPVFSNVLVHINGATVIAREDDADGTAELIFDDESKSLEFSVIDGQHRINGAYFALHILKQKTPKVRWEIPAEIFVDLDARNEPPRRQAQVFIDVNFHQKKVDRSLVADLFPTARSSRQAINDKERAEDIGRRLMLEVGPLVGMIQIPGVRFGVKDVVTLATLNSAVESVLEHLRLAKISSLDAQTNFLALCLDAWLSASGRKQDVEPGDTLDPENVAYQGRVLVSFIHFVPACIWFLKAQKIRNFEAAANQASLTTWLEGLMKKAGLTDRGRFLEKSKFREKGYVGSGGIARFRNRLWAAADNATTRPSGDEEVIAARAERNRAKILKELSV